MGSRRLTRGVRGTRGGIDAPADYPDVADVVDPEFGPSEISPCPGGDPAGTVYAVGPERERWTVVLTGDLRFGVRDPSGRVHRGRDANEALLSRGARIMYLPSCTVSGQPRARAHIGAPLVFVEGQASLFGRAA